MMIELIPCYKPPEVLEPADGALDFPSSLVASEFSPVLCRRFDTIAFMRSNQVDSSAEQARPQKIAVGCFVIDQGSRSAMNCAIGEQRLDESDFVWTGTGDHIAARRSMAVGQQHDLSALAPFGLAYTKAPFFADENVPSAMDCSRSILPSRSSLLTNRAHAFLNKPDSVHFFKRRQQVTYEGKCGGRSRHRAPVRSIQAIASKHSRADAGGRPPCGEGGGLSKRSEIKSHCSSVSSNSGSILDPTSDSASAEWDRCDISLFPFANCTHTNLKRFGPFL